MRCNIPSACWLRADRRLRSHAKVRAAPTQSTKRRMDWWRQPVTLRPRRACKDRLHSCAVPETGAWGTYRACSSRFSVGCNDLICHPGVIDMNWSCGRDSNPHMRALQARPLPFRSPQHELDEHDMSRLNWIQEQDSNLHRDGQIVASYR